MKKQKRMTNKEAPLKWWKPYVFIIVIGTLLYSQTLFFDFTYLDDNVLILDYQYFMRNLSNIGQAFKQDVFHVLHVESHFYRPILTLSFMIDTQLGSASPWIFHVTNIIVHIVSSCLVFLLLVKLKYTKDLSFFVSLIFTVHPLLSQAVGWIPGRNDSLLGIFILTSFIFFIDFAEGKKTRYFLGHLPFFIFALFTKETAVALPLICILYVRLILNRRTLSVTNIWVMIGWLIVLGFWFLIRRYTLGGGGGLSPFELSQSLLQALPGLIQQIGKILLPFNLSVMPTIRDTNIIYGILTIFILAIVFYKSKSKRITYAIFGFSWFIFFLFPTYAVRISSAENYFQLEHRLYIPMIGFFIGLIETDIVKKLNFRNKRTLIICGSIILILSIATFHYSKRFKDTFSFWKDAATNSPHSSAAQKGLGNAYFRAGKYGNAEGQYIKAIELNPNEQMVHNNLGLIYMYKNLLKEAEEEFRKEMVVNPEFDKVCYNLGLVYSKQNRIQEARAIWEKALSLNPENFDASNNLAHIYYQEGKTKEAKEMWENILHVNPDYVYAYKNLVMYYYDQKDFPKAIYYVKELRKRGVEIPLEILKKLNMD